MTNETTDVNITLDTSPPALIEKIGATTYEVSLHFSITSRETMSDKINRRIRRELDGS